MDTLVGEVEEVLPYRFSMLSKEYVNPCVIVSGREYKIIKGVLSARDALSSNEHWAWNEDFTHKVSVD